MKSACFLRLVLCFDEIPCQHSLRQTSPLLAIINSINPKTAVDVFFSVTGTLTGADSNANVNISSAGSYSAKYVSTVTVGTGGTITILIRTLPELGEASGDNFVYTPESKGATLQWTVGGSAPGKYLPKT